MKFKNRQDIAIQGYVLIENGKPVVNGKVVHEVEQYIKEKLQKEEISEATVAATIGISRSLLNKYLKEPKIMPMVIALRIAAILDEPLDELFNLGEYGWLKSYPFSENSVCYIRLDNFETISEENKSQYIKDTGYEYYDEQNGTYLSEKEYKDGLKKEMAKYKNSQEKEKAKEQYCKQYIYLFARLSENRKPMFID